MSYRSAWPCVHQCAQALSDVEHITILRHAPGSGACTTSTAGSESQPPPRHTARGQHHSVPAKASGTAHVGGACCCHPRSALIHSSPVVHNDISQAASSRANPPAADANQS